MERHANEARVLQMIDELKAQAIQMLQELIRIPSITGDERAAQFFFAEYLRKIDLEVVLLYPQKVNLQTHPAFSDDGLPLEKRPVIIGMLPGKDPNAHSIILNGHMDVVPPGDVNAWQDGPWSGAIRDGKIFGRGSCDMKGGLVSGVLAISAFQKAAIRLRGSISIQSVIGEESGGVGTLAAVVSGYRADAAIVLEPTRMAICPVGAGAASFKIHVRGKAAHGAMRHEGVSAIEKFQIILSALQEFEKQRHYDYQHPLYKAATYVAPISVGKVQAGDWPSTVPESLVAEGRFGIFPGEKIQTARIAFEKAIQSAAKQDTWLRENLPIVEWFEGQFESAETPTDSNLVATLAKNHARIMQSDAPVHGVTYGSDLRFFTNNADMPAVLYGPGDVRVAHSVNEYVRIEEVVDVAKVLALSIFGWSDDSTL